jgi:hypothetical protein
MKVSIIFHTTLLSGVLLLSACGNNEGNSKVETQTDEKVQPAETKTPQLEADFLGVYQGTQPDYFLKNQYGDDMIIAGNKVPVPSSDNKFLFKENHVVSLQQTNLEDNSRTFYEGSYKILADGPEAIKLECSISDGQGSSPTYIVTINKTDKKGVCAGSKEPEYSIKKIQK